MNATPDLDVAIVGGGPAGLQAALVLGRARRRLLACDNNARRNAPVAATRGFLSRDGTDSGLTVVLDDQTEVAARALLLAPGVIDELPLIEGLRERWGAASSTPRTATAGRSASSVSRCSVTARPRSA